MTDESLRQVCEELVKNAFFQAKYMDVYETRPFLIKELEKQVIVGFKQQQAAGVRMAKVELHNIAAVLGDERTLSRIDINEVADWCEAQAKELER